MFSVLEPPWRAAIPARKCLKGQSKSLMGAIPCLTQGTEEAKVLVLVRVLQRPAGGTSMTWVTPTFVEIDMSAEIGSYQDDFDGI
jgi:hypothetical protein